MGKVDFLGLQNPPPQTIGSRVAFSLFLFSRARIPHGGKNLTYSTPPTETLQKLHFSGGVLLFQTIWDSYLGFGWIVGRLYGKCSQVAEAWAGCNWLQRLISRYRREWGGRGGRSLQIQIHCFMFESCLFEFIYFPTKQAHFMQVNVRSAGSNEKYEEATKI